MPRRELVDVGGRERQEHAEAQSREQADGAERPERCPEDRRREREDAHDPEAAKQSHPPPDAIGDQAVDRGADEETDQPARHQEPRLAGLETPRPHYVMDDVGGIERVVAVEQGQRAHHGAQLPVERRYPRLRELLVHVDDFVSHVPSPYCCCSFASAIRRPPPVFAGPARRA